MRALHCLGLLAFGALLSCKAAKASGASGPTGPQLPTNHAPSSIALSVVEISEATHLGDEVAMLSATDVDEGDIVSIELLDSTGYFKQVKNKLVLDQALDFASTKSIPVKLRADDGLGGKLEQTITVTVLQAPHKVTNNADTGEGSLRQVIIDAPAGATIWLAPPSVVLLASGITIDKSLAFDSAALGRVAISGNDVVDDVLTVAVGVTVTLHNVTVTSGHSTGVQNDGTLVVDHCDISNNGDSAYGGGISSSGSLIVRDSVVHDNTAFNGGGIGCFGTCLIERSAIYANKADGNSGGGIAGSGSLKLVNTTVSGNALVNGTNRVGAGIAMFGGDKREDICRVDLIFSTISANHADAPDGYGGGLYLDACPLQLKGSIVAGNTATGGGVAMATAGEVVSLGDNLVDSLADNTFVAGMGDVVAAPLLDALTAADAGVTPHHMPQAASPAVDTVPSERCKDELGVAITTDQLSATRPHGSSCDKGAIERQ